MNNEQYRLAVKEQLEQIQKLESRISRLSAENILFKKTLKDIDQAIPAKIDFWWVITNGPRILRLISEWVKAIREILAK